MNRSITTKWTTGIVSVKEIAIASTSFSEFEFFFAFGTNCFCHGSSKYGLVGESSGAPGLVV
jgi:hypothetical protein